MSKFIKVTAIVASLFAGSAFADDCGKLLFSAQTANHKKEVRLCVFSHNDQNYVQYRFGKVGQKPEMEIIKPTKQAPFEFLKGYDTFHTSVGVNNAGYGYNINYGQSDDGVEFAYINVDNNGRKVTDIKLDVSTIKGSIWRNTQDYGFYNVTEESYSDNFELAPPRTY